MRPVRTVVAAASIGVVCSASMHGQSPRVNVRRIAVIETMAPDTYHTVSNVRAFADGSALVLDLKGRKLVLVDTALTIVKVVADSTLATGNSFSGRIAGLLPYLGDSSLFVNPTGMNMLVIDRQGDVARVAAIPRPNMSGSLMGGSLGFAGVDASGRIVFRGAPGQPRVAPCNSDGSRPMPIFPDTAPLRRVNISSRVMDTVTMLRIAPDLFVTVPGTATLMPVGNPLAQGDDWAVTRTGTIVVVRVLDYHAEFFVSGGGHLVGPKVPFEWRRLSDEDKAAFVDSTRSSLGKLDSSSVIEVVDELPRKVYGPLAGECYSAAAVVQNTPPERPTVAGAAPRSRTYLAGTNLLPSYLPPFTPGSVRADWDGNIWIRTSISVGGRPVYDVLDENGVLVDRLSIPEGRVIVGFGPGGSVFLAVREGASTRLERTRWKKSGGR